MKIYDPDIRELLLKKFLKTKAFISDPTTKLIHEMDVCFGTSRIDIAVINGKIHGYEIKSEQDTLDRLPAQIESYNKIFLIQ
ncbi:sce7726 family protein [Crassaminicella thermophila]|nr:sce7726 family protein [Crassaminicella thermophila]